MSILAFLVTAVLVPMLVNEFTDWLPWFAARMIRAAARTLPPGARSRYTEEWQAELDVIPGNLSKLVFAIRVHAGAHTTAAAVSEGVAPTRAITIKALFERVAAALAVGLLWPSFLVIALAIRISDPGPIFSRQARIGKNGEPFTLLKFRIVAANADGHGLRLTRVGTRLYRSSLDELPQLFNVLSGDMSLYGPRPAPPALTEGGQGDPGRQPL